MSGDQAKEFGFVRSSVPAEEFAQHVHEFRRGHLAWHSSPSSLRVMKRQVYLDAWADLEVAYVRAVEGHEPDGRRTGLLDRPQGDARTAAGEVPARRR